MTELRELEAAIHHHLVRGIIDDGFAPNVVKLQELVSAEPGSVAEALRRLECKFTVSCSPAKITCFAVVQNDKMNRYRAKDPRSRGVHSAALHDHAWDRRDRRRSIRDLARGAGRLRVALAAAHCRRSGSRTLRRRDRAHRHHDDGCRQGERRDIAKTGPSGQRRRSQGGYDPGRLSLVEPGLRRRDAREGWPQHHRGQRLATFGRSLGLRDHGGEGSGTSRPSAARHLSRNRGGAATPTKWASVPCSPYPNC